MTHPPPQIGVGVIAPFDFALDREIWRWVPADVTLLITRTPYVDAPVSIELAEAVSDEADLRRATLDVLHVEPRSVAYACTSGSFVGGLAGERRLVRAMRETGAPRAVTTSGALLEALDVLGIRRVAVATPYVEAVTARLRDFLAEAGAEVVSGAQLGLSAAIWQVPYEVTAGLVRDADSAGADAVFVSCTNLPTYDLIAPLEAELGKPVLTANQVTLWSALRLAGSAAVGAGQRLVG
ncbi:Asp/Glu/hydantoin racemase [soil metagenome]